LERRIYGKEVSPGMSLRHRKEEEVFKRKEISQGGGTGQKKAFQAERPEYEVTPPRPGERD